MIRERNKDGESKERCELERSAGMRTACHNSALIISYMKTWHLLLAGVLSLQNISMWHLEGRAAAFLFLLGDTMWLMAWADSVPWDSFTPPPGMGFYPLCKNYNDL